jgi:chorismate dehydratase
MIRIATVGYLNAEPLVSGLDTARYDIQADIPARVAEALNNGTADVALTPVVAALADAEFRIVGGIAIGSEGPVHSVVLVAETEPEEWDEIVLDGESRTSAILTRVLLKGPLGERCKARVQEVAPGVGVERARGRTAALVIGDAAMHLPDRLTVRLDLGQLWTDWTGLPFVFAVWAGRPELSATVRNDLRESAAIGLAEITTRYQGAERDYLLNNIRYELDERALMGLRRFAALAHSAGLVGSSDVVLYGPVDRVVEREGSLQGILERGALGEELTLGDLETCAEDARLSDLVAAAGLRSPAPDGPSVRFTQRVQVASTPEQVAVAVQLARSRGADKR